MNARIVACTVEEVFEDVTHWTHTFALIQMSVLTLVVFVDVPSDRRGIAVSTRRLTENVQSLLCCLLKGKVRLCTTVHCVAKCTS